MNTAGLVWDLGQGVQRRLPCCDSGRRKVRANFRVQQLRQPNPNHFLLFSWHSQHLIFDFFT